MNPGVAAGVYAAGLGAAALFPQQQRGQVTAAGCRAQILCQRDKRSSHVVTHRTRLCVVSHDPLQEVARGSAITRLEVILSAGNPESFADNRISIVTCSAVTLQQRRQLVCFTSFYVIPY